MTDRHHSTLQATNAANPRSASPTPETWLANVTKACHASSANLMCSSSEATESANVITNRIEKRCLIPSQADSVVAVMSLQVSTDIGRQNAVESIGGGALSAISALVPSTCWQSL